MQHPYMLLLTPLIVNFKWRSAYTRFGVQVIGLCFFIQGDSVLYHVDGVSDQPVGVRLRIESLLLRPCLSVYCAPFIFIIKKFVKLTHNTLNALINIIGK
jgi:hypothetical protein